MLNDVNLYLSSSTDALKVGKPSDTKCLIDDSVEKFVGNSEKILSEDFNSPENSDNSEFDLDKVISDLGLNNEIKSAEPNLNSKIPSPSKSSMEGNLNHETDLEGVLETDDCGLGLEITSVAGAKLETEKLNDKANLFKLSTIITKACAECSQKNECLYKFEKNKKKYFLCSNKCLEAYFGSVIPPFAKSDQLNQVIGETKVTPVSKEVTVLISPNDSIQVRDSAVSTVSKELTVIVPENNSIQICDPNVTMKPSKKLVYVRTCLVCKFRFSDYDSPLVWECTEFCNEQCLTMYQSKEGRRCLCCHQLVPKASMGKETSVGYILVLSSSA